MCNKFTGRLVVFESHMALIACLTNLFTSVSFLKIEIIQLK
uniref:Uncharacterized protein n=1 Tax=Parascaris equorum TaxID=6256 RepID=A0A914R9T7_PAREQ